MEEKKLTDEELLNAMEFCIKKEECGKDCRLFNMQGCMWNMFNQSFQLIRRLQNKNKLLEINLANECEEHKQFVKLAKQIDEEQKAEIERLTEENKELEKTVNDMSWIIKIHKYCVGTNHCQNRSDGEFELQKQVDELTEELDFYKGANRELTSENEMLKGIVKNKGVEVE